MAIDVKVVSLEALNRDFTIALRASLQVTSEDVRNSIFCDSPGVALKNYTVGLNDWHSFISQDMTDFFPKYLKLSALFASDGSARISWTAGQLITTAQAVCDGGKWLRNATWADVQGKNWRVPVVVLEKLFPDSLSPEQTEKFADSFAKKIRLYIESTSRTLVLEAALASGKELIPASLAESRIPDRAASDKGQFSHAEDYSSVTFNGVLHVLTSKQASIVRLLHAAALTPERTLSKASILSAIECETSEVKDFFKKSPLWKKLIIAPRRGVYGLNI